MIAPRFLQYTLALTLSGMLTAMCGPVYGQSSTASTAAKAPQTISPIPGFDTGIMDTNADPCTDFYQYACGKFADKYPIPSDLPLYDQFENLNEYNHQLLHGILEQASKTNPDRSPDEQKIGDYYASCMDTAVINADGLKPLQSELDRIDALKDKKQLPALIAHYQKISVEAFFDLGSMQDFKDATKEIAVVDQGGLGLPEKDYYLRSDAKSVKLRQEYVQHMANMLHLYGEPADKAMTDAEAVLALETSLAKVSMGIVERRDPYKTYHIETLTSLASTDPILDWSALIRDAGAPTIETLNVANPAYFQALNGIIEQTDMAILRNYLRVHLLDSFASRLPEAFDDESFDFYGRKLSGIPQMEVRWKRCVSATNAALGEALGKVYVDKYFAGNSKQQTLDMVKAIEAAMNKDLTMLSWMSPETKVKAIQKLDLITNKIGYPDKWRDYSKLIIKPGDALGNSVRAREFEAARQLNKINKPVDKQEWEMSPPTVNAYYDPSMNNINFPAGILQPAFYDRTAPPEVNYGHIGAVVGHELTHGFDDQGSLFDGNGNLKNWWTPEDKKQFDARTACIANEYSGFVAVDTLHVNGKLTLGENTADNGGIRLAYMAMEAYAHQHNVDLAKKMGDFTPEQQFFIGYAQNWCTNARPEFIRLLVQSDPHSPDQFRANGVVQNMPEFAHAFSCKKGQPMAPVDRCRVW
ncbi:MAG TPA: M13 family metallopeptidase [Acidobacteriaceae bacterium]|nr:M13 family metallopeptidase [Acidobacteriaceae bacterium]